MKRLLKISLNKAVMSFAPIAAWFVLSIILNDKNLINIFSITYPLQFIFSILKNTFGSGANITNKREQDQNAIQAGFLWGTLLGFIVLIVLILNIEVYLNFMSMSLEYKHFSIYSLIQIYFLLILSLILEKLYFINKNTTANKYCVSYSLLNLVVVSISSLFYKDHQIISCITLLFSFVYLLYLILQEFKGNIFHLKCKISKFIKYESSDILGDLFFFFIFIFGISNSATYGSEYIIIFSFVSLITDTQWDAFDAVATTAKIDIVKNNFTIKEHYKNAYKLDLILLITVLFMFLGLFKFYDFDMGIFVIFLLSEILSFILYPIYRIKICLLQIKGHALKVTINKSFTDMIRVTLSFIPSAYCMVISRMISEIYQIITVNYLYKKYLKQHK